MSLSRFQRQTLYNQHKILEILSKDKQDLEYHKMMQEVYHNGYEYEYFEHGVYDESGVLPEEYGKLVYKIINMYDDLYYYWKTSEELRDNIDEHKVMFPGFDLNDGFEHKLYSFAKFLIEDLGKFHDTKDLLDEGRIRELNSHGTGPGLSGYEAMLIKFDKYNTERVNRDFSSGFTLEEMKDILRY